MSRRWGLVLGSLLVIGAVAAPSAANAANGIVITSTAVYDVRPDDGIVVVTVDVAATNVMPDSATQRFYYDGIALPIPIGVTSISASSGGVALPVTLTAVDEQFQRADITFGTSVFYQQTYPFTLTFVMTDAGGDPEREIWVRSRFVALPVWGFGTEGATNSSVEVVMPPGFEIQVPFGDMEVIHAAGAARAVATGIDPARFTAYVSGERTGERTRSEIEVDMADGPVDVRFHAWPDDPAWTERQGNILGRGLPVLEEKIGIPYPISGTLNVYEHAYQHLGEYAGVFVAGVDTIEMRFDADAFTALHEAAHVWFNRALAEERWLTEGFASYYAEVVGREMREKLEFFSLTDELREARFPLLEWGGPGSEERAHEEFGYAASHAVARKIARLAGPRVLRTVWRQADGEELAYGRHPDEEGPERKPNSDDWRRFLDLLENASEADFDPIWRAWIVAGRRADELNARDETRQAYEATQATLGEWLMPASTRRHMEKWSFEDATAELDRIVRLVDEHAALVDRADGLGLEPSGEVGDRLGEGIDAASDELEQQAAALDALLAATDRLDGERVLLQEIGLLAEPAPEVGLDAARAAFEAGDEGEATRQAEAAAALLASAGGQGRLRVAAVGGGVLLLDAVAMAGLAILRGRRRHHGVPPTV
jgi:hypothetical protein